MIVDSSALLAVLFAEPDRERYAAALAAATSARLSTVNFVEAAVQVDMGRTRSPATPSTT
jgi:ribonuclease VapC